MSPKTKKTTKEFSSVVLILTTCLLPSAGGAREVAPPIASVAQRLPVVGGVFRGVTRGTTR